MKLAVISDIHGNFEALKMVLKDIEAMGADEIVCLGDCIGYGPEPEAVLAEIQKRNIATIIGNHEQALCSPQHMEWFNPLAKASLKMTMTMLSEASMAYIGTLQRNLVMAQCLCVHGYPPDSARTYLFQKSTDALAGTFKALDQSMCFVGHTHILELVSFDGRQVSRRPLGQERISIAPDSRYIINVGSVGQPRDGNNNAKYALYDSRRQQLEVRFIAYDIAATAAKIKAAGMPQNHANRLW